MFKKLSLLIPILFAAGFIYAGQIGAYKELQVQPVTELNGDTIGTSSTTLVNNAATLISASNPTVIIGGATWETPTLRKRVVQNVGSNVVYIGTNTADLNTYSGFAVYQATTTQNSTYTTWNTAPIYAECASGAPNGTCVVHVLTESNATY